MEMAAQAGVAPAPSRLTGGRTTVIRLSIGHGVPASAGLSHDNLVRSKSPTAWPLSGAPPAKAGTPYIVLGLLDDQAWPKPKRRRRCALPLHSREWSERQDFHLRPPGPKPGALKTELRSVKMVSAGRLALPLPPFRTENVAATPRAVCPGDLEGAGGLVRLDPDSGILETRTGVEWRTRRDLHPQPSRRQRVAPLIELRIQNWWEALVTLQSSLPACFATPDLQAGSRNASR